MTKIALITFFIVQSFSMRDSARLESEDRVLFVWYAVASKNSGFNKS